MTDAMISTVNRRPAPGLHCWRGLKVVCVGFPKRESGMGLRETSAVSISNISVKIFQSNEVSEMKINVGNDNQPFYPL